MKTVIEIKNLYKEYRLGVIGRGTLYRDIQSLIAKIAGKEDPNSIIDINTQNKNILIKENHLALNDINLVINKGETLGIIGSNGAGKSTLLKILSRITSPTKGNINIKGNIASLLEVGTGFHRELTGRENIYLNGTINGMTQKDITKKIDDIVDFADIEKYLDTPIKRYSSGMLVRLGFAIAAYLEPDILICDEVLAVGDKTFRDKAMGKMQEHGQIKGRTILFVSHNMQSIREICSKVVVLNEGKIIFNGKTEEGIQTYLKGQNQTSLNQLFKDPNFKRDKIINGKAQIKNLKIFDKSKNEKLLFIKGEKIYFDFDIRVNERINYLKLELNFLSNRSGEALVAIEKVISKDNINAGKDINFTLEIETSNIIKGEFPINILIKGLEMYNDYDYLSQFNLPNISILNQDDENVNSSTTSLFELKNIIKDLNISN